VVALAFTAVAVVVVSMADEYLVKQRVNEKRVEVNNIAIRMASSLSNTDANSMYALALESSKQNGGRYLVLNTSGVVLTDSFSKMNGMRLYLQELNDVLSARKDTSYGFHRIWDNTREGGYFWSIYYTSAIVQEGTVIGALIYSDSIQDVVEQTGKLTLGIIMLSIGVCMAVIVISLFLSGYITKPILKLRDVVQKISDGHFEQRVRVSGRSEIAELGEAFNKMSERLQNIDIQRSEFVSNASHELKTPLSSIKILVESLLYQEKLDEGIAKEFLGDINSEIDRLDNIISDLLSITRLDNQASPLNLEAVSLQKLLEKTSAGLLPLAEKKNIVMNLHTQNDIVVNCDALKIRLAVANLLDNAIKYTQPGGKVELRLSQAGSFARVEIEDTGLGITEEHLAHIFDRFYRVDRARSRETGGTGLGLYITKRIATLHGGTITVQSTEGEGSLFSLYLPLEGLEETET
jgi:signal transduction histidine kinase